MMIPVITANAADYALGNELIDSDHIGLLSAFNSILMAIKNKDNASFNSELHSLIYLAFEHFAREEQMMIDTNYPSYDYHKNIHDTIIESLRFMAASDSLQDSHAKKLAGYFINHIETVDRAFVEYYKDSKPVKI